MHPRTPDRTGKRRRAAGQQVRRSLRPAGGLSGRIPIARFKAALTCVVSADTAFRQQRLKAWQYVDFASLSALPSSQIAARLTLVQADIDAKNRPPAVLHSRHHLCANRRTASIRELTGESSMSGAIVATCRGADHVSLARSKRSDSIIQPATRMRRASSGRCLLAMSTRRLRTTPRG